MNIIRGLSSYKNTDGNCLAIGTFDGVHIGHQKILNALVSFSKANGINSTILTFDYPPKYVITGKINEHIPMLTPFPKKEELFAEIGIDCIIEQKFDRLFSHISAIDFIDKIISEKLKPRHIFIGYDFRFGYEREGNVALLKRKLSFTKTDLTVIPPVLVAGERVSSSSIRKLIASGNVAQAQKLLGRYFFISGVVENGTKLASALGFPTANIKHFHSLVPSSGVYAVFVDVRAGHFAGICYVGASPTFNLKRKEIEVHIFDLSQTLYDQPIKIHFVLKIRDEMKFESTSELIEQIKKDIIIAQKILK